MAARSTSRSRKPAASGHAGTAKSVSVRKTGKGRTMASANGKAANSKSAAAKAGASGRYSLVTLRHEFDRIMEELSSSLSLNPFRARAMEVEPFRRLQSAFALSMPAVDVVERHREYKITAELPGMDRKDIELSVSDDVITIKGEKKSELTKQKKNVHLSERRYGSFERSFRLPEGASADGIDASYRHGVLTITLPKTSDPRSRQRKISVRAS